MYSKRWVHSWYIVTTLGMIWNGTRWWRLLRIHPRNPCHAGMGIRTMRSFEHASLDHLSPEFRESSHFKKHHGAQHLWHLYGKAWPRHWNVTVAKPRNASNMTVVQPFVASQSLRRGSSVPGRRVHLGLSIINKLCEICQTIQQMCARACFCLLLFA